MKLATCLFAVSLFGQTTVKPAQLGVKPTGQLSLIVVDGSGKINTAFVGNGITVLPTQDGKFFLSCTYATGGLPGRATLKPEGQVVTLPSMPRLIDIYRNGVLMSPDDGDYQIQQVGGKTTITFSDAQKIDASDVIRAIYWQ